MIEILNLKKLEYKVGLRLISGKNSKGIIIDYKISSFGGKDLILVEWRECGKKDIVSKVAYTKPMFDEALSEGVVKIDKEFYRNQRLEELGI